VDCGITKHILKIAVSYQHGNMRRHLKRYCTLLPRTNCINVSAVVLQMGTASIPHKVLVHHCQLHEFSSNSHILSVFAGNVFLKYGNTFDLHPHVNKQMISWHARN
jgi:hypothetical protein